MSTIKDNCPLCDEVLRDTIAIEAMRVMVECVNAKHLSTAQYNYMSSKIAKEAYRYADEMLSVRASHAKEGE